MTKYLHIVEPVGFCGSVRRAMEIFRCLCAEHLGEPIYVLHELVHNAGVSAEMRSSGAVFVEDINDVPEGALVLLGAHGHGPSVDEICACHRLRVTDATCPLVSSLHLRMLAVPPDMPIIFLGDANHAEVVGVIDCLRNRPLHVIANAAQVDSLPNLPAAAFFCQTTQGILEIQHVRDALAKRIAHLEDYASPCPAVNRRQQSLLAVASQCEAVIIVGSRHSANARRLAELARSRCAGEVIVCENAEAIPEQPLASINHLGLASATSTPDEVFQKVVEHLATLGFLSL